MNTLKSLTPTSSSPAKARKRKERRKESRYEIRGAALFRWRIEGGEAAEGEGITRNVSRSGALIEAQVVPAEGAQVTVTVNFPGKSGNPVKLQLSGAGTVRRIEHIRRRASGFALQITFNMQLPS